MRTLAQWLSQLGGARLVGDPQGLEITRVHTDSRNLRPGDLFVALRGERFDAHDYLVPAREAGAVAAIAEQGLAAAGLPGVEVPDSRRALGELALRWRAQFDLPLIAVTGSNGKTTVTQMLAAILRAAAGDRSLATQGNLNNDIGVPLTLLRLTSAHRLAVVELGMNHPGEIAGLAAIAQPTVALVNNAQREHQEFMATVEAVARENGAVFAALPADGCAVFPADDEYTPLWRALAGDRRVLTFGGADADVHAEATWGGEGWRTRIHTPQGTCEVALRIAGRHNVRNALAATASALAAGIGLEAVAAGLSAFEPVTGRSRALTLALGERSLVLVDDSYNANPDSVRAATEVLAELPGPRLLALGDMGEVGDQGLAFHQEVLRHALERDIEHVWVTGDWMAQAVSGMSALAAGRLRHFKDYPELQAAAQALAPTLGAVLVKGSRFMRMERLVQALCALQDKEGQHHAA
jgi:UDP-N-acetylmuramoyl-tripeptide--D-alanyl-D-alanine ligase